jgi:ankyrin repeat protein
MDPAQEIFDVVRAGDIARLKALLAAQPGLASSRNERGHSPVLIAQYHHKAEAVAVLLAAKPQLDIFDAASVGDAATVREWLDRDPTLLNAYSNDGFYPLGLAAFFGHPETVRLLLARGADVAQAARNPMRVQPLHAGAASKSFEVVKLLVEAGAPVNAQQHKGWTPLHEAVRQGSEAMVRLLLSHGADPKQQNEDGKSAIGLAADEAKPAILKLLKGQE